MDTPGTQGPRGRRRRPIALGARAQPPIPEAAPQKWYKIALSELAKAAADCQAAISAKPDGDEEIQTHENAALLTRARSESAAGSKDLYRATAGISALGTR